MLKALVLAAALIGCAFGVSITPAWTYSFPFVDNIAGFNSYIRLDADAGYGSIYDGTNPIDYIQESYGINIYSYFNITFVFDSSFIMFQLTTSFIPFDVVPFMVRYRTGIDRYSG